MTLGDGSLVTEMQADTYSGVLLAVSVVVTCCHVVYSRNPDTWVSRDSILHKTLHFR